MHIKNTENRYGIVAYLFHWVAAFLIIGLLAMGLYMKGLHFGAWKLKLYGWHKEFGMLILALFFLRLAWRFSNITPSLPANLPGWQKLSAHAVHFAFYVFMLLMPITGWLVTSAAGLPVSFFGWFVLPNLISPSEEHRLFFSEVHEWAAYGLIATLCAHVGAALKHHFINKDNILRRMLWP